MSRNNERTLPILEDWQKFVNKANKTSAIEDSSPCTLSLSMDHVVSPHGAMRVLLDVLEGELSKQGKSDENDGHGTAIAKKKHKAPPHPLPAPVVFRLPTIVDLHLSFHNIRRNKSQLTLETKNLLIEFLQKCQIRELHLIANSWNPASSSVGTMELSLAADLEKVTSLRSLSVHGFPLLLPVLFSCLSARNCQIQELSLTQHQGVYSSVDSISSSSVSEQQMEELQAALQTPNGSALEQVHISDCDLRGNRLVSFLSALRHCKKLKHLIFGEDCALPVSLDAIAWFVDSHSSLETLDVSMNDDAVESYLVLDVDLLVEAILAHSNLKNVKLPLWPCQARLAADLMFYCAHSNVMQSVYLEIARLDKHTSPGIDHPDVHLNIFDFGSEAADWLPQFMERVPQIPNITLLNTEDCTVHCSAIQNIFLETQCRLSVLSLFHHLDRDEFDHLEQGLRGYKGLKELRLRLEHPFPVQNLCRKSRLERVCLLVEHGQESTIMESCAHVLEVQPKLLSLEVAKHEDLDDDEHSDDDSEQENEDHDPRQTIAFEAFAKALQTHPSLKSLTIGYGGSWKRKNFHHCIKHIFGALEHNSILQMLDLSDSDVSVGSIAKALPKVHVGGLLLPLSDYSKRDWKQLFRAMKQNLSIRRIQPVWLAEPPCREYNRISKLLHRNQLVNRAQAMVDKLAFFPKSLWPSILSKLGCNQREASPVFCFVRAGAEVLGAVAPSKKRKRYL